MFAAFHGFSHHAPSNADAHGPVRYRALLLRAEAEDADEQCGPAEASCKSSKVGRWGVGCIAGPVG
eukprot:2140945-Alexandrium_andersonii.AAC.1